MYKIGEALLGSGNEVAHIDLLIGEKEGKVGMAFANGLVNLSKGHTSILSLIRPNLPPKPHTLIVPKVTIEDMDDADKIFGPAQSGVAKAVADCVEEEIIPKNKLDEWVIIASVFIHPKANDYRKIFRFNYSATKLAIKRALNDYPKIEKLLYDKDRAMQGIDGYKIPKLWMPPYLQIAFDITNIDYVKKIIQQIPGSDRIIIEAGTPLIKEYGVKVINELRKTTKNSFIVADLKTLDVGNVEVDLAFEQTADAVVASGLAPVECIDKFIYEAKRTGIYSVVDTLNVKDPIGLLKLLKQIPDVLIIHRAIDVERCNKNGIETQKTQTKDSNSWKIIQEIKKQFNIIVAVAGGITPQTAPQALSQGADIIIVGRYITQARDIERTIREFTGILGLDKDHLRAHIE
ncbi:MAG: formaldehyde-activating enzyme [Candidatus Aenigmarchaeota archaeon ex4484_52]|nr:MAG: formaldehyde-activating enzyme [Candidatus Aenigmarchaeota archaeon ex4484_52]